MSIYTYNNWDEWLSDLAKPLESLPCGEDLKYEEDFKYLKSSFSSLADVDYKKVFTVGTDLLSKKSKDIRIVGYVMSASSSEFGVAGVANGLALFNQLLRAHQEDIHPTSAKARKSVHTWLLGQQSRLVAMLEQQGSYERDDLTTLKEALVKYGTESVGLLDENGGPLSEVGQWVDKKLKSMPAPVVKEEVKNNTPDSPAHSKQEQNTQAHNTSAEAQPSASLQQVAVSKTLDSDAAYFEQLRSLLTYDKDQNNFARAISLSRAARWGDVKIPPNENGKTRIPAPRSAAFTPIKNALSNNDYKEALLKSEALFLEGAMHLNLDLQLFVYKALKGLQDIQLQKQHELLLFSLVERFSDLTKLCYDDGSALCSAATKDYIEGIKTSYQAGHSQQQEDDIFSQTAELAQAELDKGQLEKALQIIATMPVLDDFEKARKSLLQAQFCIKAENYIFAKPILEQLLTTVNKNEINKWQKDFVMLVWRASVQCFDALSETVNDDFYKRSQNIKELMIVTQPELALSWL
ncbi:TssA family type VI secretion system protein [Flocculibacter collagenilyticus]|uniref:TssA family type VI secretion system protein n=1 Tax=Flocculibacter collagenilyticus TaxID=2744479 RepID=UPI0018F77B17|nr:TssA family type VI secretion system protein [Flocculibacter collagenilyticus]